MPPSGVLPPVYEHAKFRQEFGLRFLLTVDTEEDRRAVGAGARTEGALQSLPRLAKFQQFCESEGVSPVYMVGYPVATSALAADVLREPVKRAKAEIGIQFSPCDQRQYDAASIGTGFTATAGSQGDLERARFTRLRTVIERNFETVPQLYRAGPLGFGPHTLDILRENGIAMDSSIRSRFDFSSRGGIDFTEAPVTPYWLNADRSLLELPLTAVFAGRLRRHANWLYPAANRSPFLRAIFKRSAMLERIALAPEGTSAKDAVNGIDMALEEDLPLLVFSFHSPSLFPGNTPYVQDSDDLDRLYDWWRQVFAHLRQREVRPTSVRETMAHVQV